MQGGQHAARPVLGLHDAEAAKVRVVVGEGKGLPQPRVRDAVHVLPDDLEERGQRRIRACSVPGVGATEAAASTRIPSPEDEIRGHLQVAPRHLQVHARLLLAQARKGLEVCHHVRCEIHCSDPL